MDQDAVYFICLMSLILDFIPALTWQGEEKEQLTPHTDATIRQLIYTTAWILWKKTGCWVTPSILNNCRLQLYSII